VITKHTTKTGEPKLVEECSFPLTAIGVVNRIYTDLAVIDVTEDGFALVELAPGVDFDHAADSTGAPLIPIGVEISGG
jgi:acyl CoA:acetate/3-ketoacid CoA transferase beta subunit